RRRGEAADDVGGEENVAVAADEAIAHLVFSAEQRGEDVVVLPIGVFAKAELRISGFDLVDLVAADEADVGKAVSREGIDGPVNQSAAGDFGEAFGRVGRGRHEASAAAGTDNNYAHGRGGQSSEFRGQRSEVRGRRSVVGGELVIGCLFGS